MKTKIHTISLIALISLLFGCSSLQHSFDSDVQIGMDKAEVLEAVGGPQLTKRRNNEDVWQYYFYTGDLKTIKELHFKNNKVSYKGDPVQPRPDESAKAIDARNSRLPPSFSTATSDELTPKQRQENLEKYINEDEETKAKKPTFKEL